MRREVIEAGFTQNLIEVIAKPPQLADNLHRHGIAPLRHAQAERSATDVFRQPEPGFGRARVKRGAFARPARAIGCRRKCLGACTQTLLRLVECPIPWQA